MANRAMGQIKLNETRDTLRETNQSVSRKEIFKSKYRSLTRIFDFFKIVSLEDEIMALKQQLIKEKAEARDEKSKLEEKRVNDFFLAKSFM